LAVGTAVLGIVAAAAKPLNIIVHLGRHPSARAVGVPVELDRGFDGERLARRVEVRVVVAEGLAVGRGEEVLRGDAGDPGDEGDDEAIHVRAKLRECVCACVGVVLRYGGGV